MKGYIIEYEVRSQIGEVLKGGKIKVKNKESSIQAQIALEAYLQKRVIGFYRLVVKKCEEDTISNLFGSLFGKGTPFW